MITPAYVNALKALPVGETLLLEGASRKEAAGSLKYWGAKLNCGWKTKMTTKGLRVWKRANVETKPCS